VQADIDAVGGDASRVKVATLNGDTWLALSCSASSTTLDCPVPHLSVFGLVRVPPAATPQDTPISGGWFYKQANGFNGAGDLGFAVADDANANFWTEYQRLGGVDRFGYPISQRFEYGGLPTQAFQKAALQWHAELGQAVPVNIFDDLTRRGNDTWLDQALQIPPTGDQAADATLSPDATVARQLQMLENYPAVRDFYAANSLAPTLYGLPLAVKDYGQFVSVRFDRATLRLWTTAVPWAAAGTITIESSGDIAKSVGLWPDTALVPGPPPATATADTTPADTDTSPTVDDPAASETTAVVDAPVPEPSVADAPSVVDVAPVVETPAALELPPASDADQGQ
jgi:hypothetical protein